MRSGMDAARRRRLHGPLRAGEVVSAVDGLQRAVVARLDAVFDHDVVGFGEPGEVVEFAFVDAVRARADDDPGYLRHFERLRKNGFEPLQRRIRIRKGLEVGQVFFRGAVAAAVEFDSLFQLLPDVFLRRAIGRRESRVVAERASAGRDRAVAVRAGESGVDRQFLHAGAEQPPEVSGIAVVTSRIPPGIGAAGTGWRFCFRAFHGF